MKKFSKLLSTSMTCITLYICSSIPLFGQTTIEDTRPQWQVGKIYLKISDSSTLDLSTYPSISDPDIANIMAQYNVVNVERPFIALNTTKFDRTYRITFTDTLNTDSFINDLQSQQATIEYAEKVPMMYPQIIPNDPQLGFQYFWNMINANGVSNIYQTNPGAAGNAIIAIVDDAVLTTHEDLAANIFTFNQDVADLDSDPNPPFTGITATNGVKFSHGTHVSGIAGGVTNNGLGIASVGWSNNIMGIKTRMSSDNSNGLPFAYDGVVWAIANGAQIINMSWGGGPASLTEYNILLTAQSQNIVLVAAAGNSGTGTAFYPAAYGEGTTGQPWEIYDRTLVIAVAALDVNNDRSIWPGFGSSGSNFGQWVDISAYGTAIRSSISNSSFGTPIINQYADYNGTSMAAPMVSGIAGIIISYNPAATATDVYNCIVYSANPDIYGPLHPSNTINTLGTGRLDAEASLQCIGVPCTNNPVAIISPSSTTICPGGNVTLTANSGISYLWSTGATTQSISVNTPGVYSVTVTFPGGCTSTASITITNVNTTLTLDVFENSGFPNDGIICGPGSSANGFSFCASAPGSSYTWSSFSFLNWGQCTGYMSLGATVPDVFTMTVTVTDMYGCIGLNGTASFTINQVNPPTVTIAPSAPSICSGQSVSLTASGASSYTWSPATGLSATTGATVIATPTVTTTYTVTGIDNTTGCEASSSVTVTVQTSCGCTNCTDLSTTGTISTSPPSNGVYCFNQNTTLSGNVSITNSTLLFDANVKLIIPNGFTLSIDKSSLYSCGTDMWDGIEIQPGGNLIIFNKSLIEDAKVAVLSDNTGMVADFEIRRTAFNRNYIGVKVINHTGSVHPGLIINCTFDSQPSVTSTTNTAFLDAPFASQTAEYGVELADVHSIVIGNAALAGFKNRFGYLHVGIRANKSKYTAVNNEFKNMYPNLSTWGIWNTSTQALIGGYLANQPNNFENSYNGIKHETNSDLEVYKNTFTNITSPLFPLNKIGSICVFTLNMEASNVTLKDNVLTNFQTGFRHQNCNGTIYTAQVNQFKDFTRWGIFGLQDKTGVITVSNNNFNVNVYSAFTGNNAINFSNAVLPLSSSPVLTVSNNSINRINRGVEVINYDRPIVVSNTVAFPASLNTSVLHYGIRSLNSDKEYIQGNTITKTGAFPNSSFLNQIYGISVEGNISRVTVTQNTVARVGDGLRFRGYSNLNSTVSCNKMNYNYSGLTLDAVGIGDQGSSAVSSPPDGIANDNQWTNPSLVSGSLAVRGLALSAPFAAFYTRSAGYPWCPLAGDISPVSSIITSSNSAQPTVPNAPTNCPNICYNPPCIFFPLVRIAQNQSPYDIISGNEKYLLQQSLLKTILSDSIIQADTSTEAVILRFYRDTTLTNTEFGKLAIVSDSIATGDTTFAKTLNDLVFDTRCAETYQKTVNGIYLRSWARNRFFFTPADSAALEIIAYDDPIICGPAVYDARVMLSLDINDFSPESRSNLKPDEQEMIVGKIGVLYPNPASVSCIYEAELEKNQTGIVEIYNINGEFLHNFKLNEGVNRVEIDLTPYQSGVYVFKIMVDDDTTEIKRLVITK